jgi:peptidoglycan hydrolase-like protein with peptidoglycan-binding domain
MGAATNTSQIRLRRLIRLGVITLLVLTLLGLLLFYTPRYLARYLLASQLDELHIDHSGVETLTINPFTRELWLGPVRIGSGTTEAAQLETLGLTLGYSALLHRRIFIERLILRGIDLAVTRDKQNRFILNGISLNELLPPSKEAQAADAGEVWKPGIAAFELRDSRLIFQDQDRGELAVDIERLSLLDFLAWEPEKPGRFEFTAQVNDIQLNGTGEARPFADNITLSIDSRTERADLPKIIRFTGPLGLDRREGIYGAQLRHELTLFHAGGFEGHTQGVIEVKAADYQRKDVFAVVLERAKSDLDVKYAMQASGDLSLHGKLSLDLGPGQVSMENQTQVAVAGGRIDLDSLDTAYASNGNLRIALRPELDLEQVAFSGPIEISVDKLLDLLTLLQSLSVAGVVSTTDTGLGDFAGGSVSMPSSDIKVARLHSKGDSLSLQSADGKLDFALQTNTDLFDIQIGVDERRINVERLQSKLEHLSLVSGQGQLIVDLAGSNSLVTGSSISPIGELQIGSLENKLTRFALQVQTGAIALQLAGEDRVSGFSALVYAKESLPEVQLHLGAVSSTLSQAALDMQGETLHWQAAGDASADALTVAFAKGKESEVKFERAEIRGLQADQRLQLAANSVMVDGLDIYLKRSLLKTLFKGNESETEQTGSTQPEDDKASDAVSNDLARAQALLSELGYDPGSVDGYMGQRTAAAIKAFQKKEGITTNGRMSAALLAQLELRAAGSTPDSDSGAPGVQIGQLALNGKSVIRFHDDIVEPSVKINTTFKEFQVQNLSTRAQSQQTDLHLAALINEFTNLEVTGWTKGFNRAADLDLRVQVKNLELSTYSPYVAELAGVYLESGQLDTQITGKAARGILQGQVQLDLEHMEFKPLSEEDAARMTETVGVPLEMAVSLLEDGDGRIALKLPLGGTLTKPDVDISSAVNKAIGGVLKRVFPPTLAVSLLSKIAKGGGPAFDPIAFAAGSAEFDEAGRQYADKVAKFLKEHPKLTLKLCGRATAQDMAQLAALAPDKTKTTSEQTAKDASVQQAEATPAKAEPSAEQSQPPAATAEILKELALKRKSVVRAYLIDTKQINAKRVPECRSSFRADDQGSPRVEIVF